MSFTGHSQIAMEFIQRYIEAKQYPPSRREIGQAVGLKSSSSVQSLLDAMVRAGLIEVDRGIDRGIRVKRANMKARTEEMK